MGIKHPQKSSIHDKQLLTLHYLLVHFNLSTMSSVLIVHHFAVIKWRLPEGGNFKFNIDGSVKPRGNATCGGILGDCHGSSWICVFVENMVGCVFQSLTLNLLAFIMLWGWDGTLRLVISLLRLILVMLLSWCFTILSQIRSWISQGDWNVSIVHAYRQANKATYWMASMAHELPVGMHDFEEPPLGVLRLLFLNLIELVSFL